MLIKLAKKIGFCFGVKRAVTMAEEALKTKGRIYSLGSIIHNREVVRALSKKGLKVIKDTARIRRGTIIISSHGLSPRVALEIRRRGLEIIDTTCPFVRKAQAAVKLLGQEGYAIVVVGDANHPEIKALVDFVPKNIFVVKNRGDIRKLGLKKTDRVSVISQTTQSTKNFLDVVKALAAKGFREFGVYNTICKDAEARQSYAKSLAREADLMLIIGGRDSANTNRLFEVCRNLSKESHLIETEKELKDAWLKSARVVGITSGASTPDWVIKKVVNKIRSLERSYSSRSRDEICTQISKKGVV
ncbi:MAG: 4-hydroxy-3-methylbut-2-enyl diphosphate reductase [Candidatus Omnitrophica bacterium]|nr:4-hydroxy-3-methylbut-2-enyl diphosphate reductase [Candidatus Omnitrophota bacterium]